MEGSSAGAIHRTARFTPESPITIARHVPMKLAYIDPSENTATQFPLLT
jgi:hypothetical protein